MQNDIIIEVKNVTKYFKIYDDKAISLKDLLLNFGSKKYKKRLVLDEINLLIKKGECVALAGQNGCGKSTLLKMITKIIYPSSGSINTYGKIASLLELGAGFHPDFTGLENIYINASILGMKKNEVDNILDSIISFSELKEYINNPVRTYSSGMYMRLAFSIAIHVNADILVIDEILAVGDYNFQKKCYEKLRELRKEGVTIVLVSHESSIIRRFCDRAVVIENHKIAFDGVSNSAMDYYEKKQ